jgi:hypothetical protein
MLGYLKCLDKQGLNQYHYSSTQDMRIGLGLIARDLSFYVVDDIFLTLRFILSINSTRHDHALDMIN